MAGYRFLAYISRWASVTLALRGIINVVWTVSGLFLGCSACSRHRLFCARVPLPAARAFLACQGFFSLHRLWFGDAWEIVPKLSKLLKETVTVMPGCFILKGKKAISDHILITQKHENSQISFPS